LTVTASDVTGWSKLLEADTWLLIAVSGAIFVVEVVASNKAVKELLELSEATESCKVELFSREYTEEDDDTLAWLLRADGRE
jgi:hypothetical protein